MAKVEDEFELLLNRCRESLGEISLRLPDLEAGAPPCPPALRLEPEPPPLPPPPLLTAVEEPFPGPPTAGRPAPPPAPDLPPPAEDEPEIEVFPPPAGEAGVSADLETPRPTPTPSSRSNPRWGMGAAAGAAAAVAAAAAAAGVWWTRRPAPELALSIDPAQAMAVLPDGLEVAEGRELVRLSRDGRLLGRAPLDGPVASLRWDDGSLWSVDGLRPEVVERRDGQRPTVFHLNHVPTALFVKGKYLWTVDGSAHALHQFLISRSILGVLLQPLDLYDLGRLTPETFAVDDDGTLWVVDAAGRRLHRLTLAGGAYRSAASAPLSTIVGPQGPIRSLSLEGNAVWLLTSPADGGRATLRRIPLNRLNWTES